MSPRQDGEHIELIEIGELDNVLAEFPTEDRLLLDGPNASALRESDSLADEFPSASSSVGEAASEEPAEEFPSELAAASVRLGAAHLRAPVLAAAAAFAVIAITGALGLEPFIRSRPRDERPSATRASDVVLLSEATSRQSSAPVEELAPRLEPQTSLPVGLKVTGEERTPTPPPPPPRILERSGPTTGAGLLETPTLGSTAVLAASTNSPPVATPPRTAADLPVSSPVGTAGAPDAGERQPVGRPADVDIVSAGRAPVAPVVTPTNAVQRALAQYQNAFSQLDVAAVRQVWPTVDGKALARAFDQLRQENLRFDSCDVSVFGQTAVASCVGTTQYVPKVGNKSVRVERQQWRISLRQVTDAWVIDTVEVSRD